MRRFFAIVLAALLLAGCGGEKPETSPSPETGTPDAKSDRNINPDANGVPLLEFLNDPAITAFAKGFDSNPPVAVCVMYQDVSGGEPHWVRDESTVRAVFEALSNMVVLDEMGSSHTDDYLYYYFEQPDGAFVGGFCFQQGMLEMNGAVYSVQGFDALNTALAYPSYGGETGQQSDIIWPSQSIPGGEVQMDKTATYTLFAQTDPQYQMEAFRTLLPEGWSGSGAVIWDYASASAPVLCRFGAFSSDGMAGLLRSTDMHFVDQVYSGGGYSNDTFASPDGTPLRKSCTSIEMAYEIPPQIYEGITNMHITGSENADPQGTLQSVFEQALSGEIAAANQIGSSISGVYCTMDAIYGTATIDGYECDFEAYVTMAGYTLQSPGNYVTITSNYWSMMNTQFFYAPVGRMADYVDDMAIITDNYIENANWISLRGEVNALLLNLLREKQLQDWARANEFSEFIYSQAYYNRNPSNDYSVVSDRQDATSFWHERWEDTLTGKETFDMGGGESVTVDGLYDRVYSDGAGSIIGSNDPGFDPGAGYTQLNPITR